MTEQQIRDGYERLDSALAAPTDAADRVAGRVRVRRRRRRAALAGRPRSPWWRSPAAPWLSPVATTAATPWRSTSRPVPGARWSLPTGRVDVLLPDVTVTCTPPELTGGDPLGTGTGRIWMYSPFHLTGTDGDTARVTEPFPLRRGDRRQDRGDRTFTWPNDWSMDTADVPLTLFVADTEGRPRGNEVSTNEADARGTVRVVEASCDPVPVLRLEVETTLGSEVGRPPEDDGRRRLRPSGRRAENPSATSSRASGR